MSSAVQELKSGYNKEDGTWRCVCARLHKGKLTIVSRRTWYRHNPGGKRASCASRQEIHAQGVQGHDTEQLELEDEAESSEVFQPGGVSSRDSYPLFWLRIKLTSITAGRGFRAASISGQLSQSCK